MSQLYLIKFSAMYKSDGLDVVPSAEFIVDQDLSTNSLSLLDALFRMKNDFTQMVADMPGPKVRPMTREEIEEWREEQHADEESGFETVDKV